MVSPNSSSAHGYLKVFSMPSKACMTSLSVYNWARLFETNDVVVNVSLKFQTLISNICQYFLLKKCVLIFSTKISVYLVIKL